MHGVYSFPKYSEQSGLYALHKDSFLGINDHFLTKTLRRFVDPWPLPTFGAPIIRIFFLIGSLIFSSDSVLSNSNCKEYDYDYGMNQQQFGSNYQMQINVKKT